MISYLLGALQVGLCPKGQTETNQNAKTFRPRYQNSWKQIFGSGDDAYHIQYMFLISPADSGRIPGSSEADQWGQAEAKTGNAFKR